jgi:hypothetical protein
MTRTVLSAPLLFALLAPSVAWAIDADGDGFDEAVDCDDANPVTYPGAVELCDNEDNDCDGVVDNGIASVPWYLDVDGDGFGDSSAVIDSCAAPSGYALLGGDCDDLDPGVSPAAAEVCDGVDNDCDGAIDDAAVDAMVVFEDFDGDGFGGGPPLVDCTLGPNQTSVAGDCNDSNPLVNPAAAEVCDLLDNDCNGLVDDSAIADTWFEDADGDGYGSPGAVLESCVQPVGFVDNAEDCDDSNPNVNPGVPEDPNNGIDDDCDGSTTAPPPEDADGDGFSALEDCDDLDPAVFPGAPELCDGIDSNCDGIAEEDSDLDGVPNDCDDCPLQVGPEDNDGCPDDPPGSDADGDGWDAPEDCDDTDPLVFPGAIEICEDGIDQSCDGEDAACGPEDDDDKEAGCGAAAIILPLPLLVGLARRRR